MGGAGRVGGAVGGRGWVSPSVLLAVGCGLGGQLCFNLFIKALRVVCWSPQ